MPRQYKRILGHGRRNSVIYPPERMQEALNAGMGMRAAALTYGVPRSTLQDRVKQKHPASSGGQTVFQPMEERIMAQNIALLGDWGFPLDVLDVRMLVKQYLTVTEEMCIPSRMQVSRTFNEQYKGIHIYNVCWYCIRKIVGSICGVQI